MVNAIIGSEKAWPKGEKWIQRFPITVKVLPKIDPPKTENSSKAAYNKVLSKLTKDLENKITKAVSELEETTNFE